MKPILKLSLTLLLNQFLADIACSMCIISFPFMFGDSVFTYSLFTALTVFFFYYISYHGAYKSGFHDVDRRTSDEYDRKYVKRSFLAALIAALPTILMFLLFIVGKIGDIIALQVFEFPLSLWTLYGSWPLSSLFPNHTIGVYIVCIVMQLVFPMIGYICGYKGLVFGDKIKKLIFDKIKS